MPLVFRKKVWEVGPKRPTARVVDENGNLLVINDVTAITLNIYDFSAADPDLAIFTTTRTPGSTMFNALQTWSVDGTGFNFQDLIRAPQDVTLEGGHLYRISYLLTTTNGDRPVVFEWVVRSLASA